MENSMLDLIAGFVPPDKTPQASSSTGAQARNKAIVSVTTQSRRPEHTKNSAGKYGVHLICFSKDRAFQLDQLLKSVKRHVLGRTVINARLSVLYLATGDGESSMDLVGKHLDRGVQNTSDTGAPHQKQQSRDQGKTFERIAPRGGQKLYMEDSYALVAQRHQDVTFVKEQEGKFRRQLEGLVQHKVAGETNFVLFVVDDMFFYRDFDVANAVDLLQNGRRWCVEPLVGNAVPVVSRPALTVLRLCIGVAAWFIWAWIAGTVRMARSCVMVHTSDVTTKSMLPRLAIMTLADRTSAFMIDPTIFCVHSRLHPGITWSHSAGAPCKVPPLSHTSLWLDLSRGDDGEPHGHSHGRAGGVRPAVGEERAREEDVIAIADCDLLTFRREEGSGEWNYPWDLSGGLYRQQDAEEAIKGIVELYGEEAVANPNLLEFNGDRLLRTQRHRSQEFKSASGGVSGTSVPKETATTAAGAGAFSKKSAKRAPRCACPGKAVVFSLAVNRVQTTYATPVYPSSGAGSVLSLDRRLWLGRGDDVGNRSHGKQGRSQDGTGNLSGRQAGVEATSLVDDGVTTAPLVKSEDGFDEDVYVRKAFNSVHIGELAFLSERDAGGRGYGRTAPGSGVREGVRKADKSVKSHKETVKHGSPSDGVHAETDGAMRTNPRLRPLVTVLLPVRDGGAYLIDAMTSLLVSAAEQEAPGPVELLVVDDGSDDGSMDVVVEAVAAAGILDTIVENSADVDARMPREWETGPTAALIMPPALRSLKAAARALGEVSPDKRRLSVRVIRHQKPVGLACSLNEGLREARAELVARMDADDICMPGRLRRQVDFLLANPGVSALGSSVAIFTGDSVHTTASRLSRERDGFEESRVCIPSSAVQRVARHPTDAVFAMWSLFFSCCIAHPSVVLRRSAALDIGGYDTATEPAEDYDLWLRMAEVSPTCVVNLEETLLGLRKHANNVSHLRREEQVTAAHAAAARAMCRLLGRPVAPCQAAAVRCPEGTTTADELEGGARLLVDLEAAIFDKRAPPGFKTESDQEGLRRGLELIRRDAEARLGAMAVHAMSRFGGGAGPILDAWRKRYPGRPLLQALTGCR